MLNVCLWSDMNPLTLNVGVQARLCDLENHGFQTLIGQRCPSVEILDH